MELPEVLKQWIIPDISHTVLRIRVAYDEKGDLQSKKI